MILQQFWDKQICVARTAGYYGETFDASRGVTQGGVSSPMIFNIVLDAVLREFDRQIASAPDRVPEACNKLLYADDSWLAGTHLPSLQGSVDILVPIFKHGGLSPNSSKSKLLITSPGNIHHALSPAAYRRRFAPLTPLDPVERYTECTLCTKNGQPKKMLRSSLARHLREQHDNAYIPTRPLNDEIMRHSTQCWIAEKNSRGQLKCPVIECASNLSGSNSNTLRQHFCSNASHTMCPHSIGILNAIPSLPGMQYASGPWCTSYT